MFGIFYLAETLGQTVTELLTGNKAPLSQFEFIYWMEYFHRKGEVEAEASKPKKKDGQATQNFKKTMGNRQTAM